MKINLENLKLTEPQIKKLFKKYKRKYNKTYDDIRDKVTGREKRRVNPVVAIFGVLSVLGVIFCGLVSFFYLFYSNVYNKKIENYMTVGNDDGNAEKAPRGNEVATANVGNINGVGNDDDVTELK